jgi:hypothetical protein
MSEQSSSTKSKRTELDTSLSDGGPSQTPRRSEIWMPYGDIILEVESTQFRVNRDILEELHRFFTTCF